MIQVKSEQQVLQEGFQILLSNMEPSTVARFWAACNIGRGDYLTLKDEIFAQESVASLYSKIVEFQAVKRKA
jgi:N-dimethylarginine dimethylaminohydrolase